MSEQEMTYNQALQELTRFGNIWQAAAKLKEALQLATSVEHDVIRLREEKKRLENDISSAESAATTAWQGARNEIEKAKTEADTQRKELDQISKQRQQEYDELIARKERETNGTIDHLQRLLTKRRQEIRESTASLNKEIAIKQTLIEELDVQLSNMRKRLE